MASNAESVIVRADMSAFEYHEAAWEAREGRTPPSDSVEALEAECRRRGLLPDAFDRVLGLGLLAVVAISGSVTGWMLIAS